MPSDTDHRLWYEIHICVDGRWTIAEIVEAESGADRRDERAEREAVAGADRLLARGGISAVKVMRERRTRDGRHIVHLVHSRDAAIVRQAPMLAPGAAADGLEAPLCDELDDLATRQAEQIIGAVARPYLESRSIAPLELVHHAPHQRKLMENPGPLYAAIRKIGTRGSCPGASRSAASDRAAPNGAAALTRVIDDALAQAKAIASQPFPAYAGNFAAWNASVAAAAGKPGPGYCLRVALARHLAPLGSYEARLDCALEMFDSAVAEPQRHLLDRYVASCLDSPSLVAALLGSRANLGAALAVLAELPSGGTGRTGSETLRALQSRLRAGWLPVTADAIWSRLLKELTLAKPLSRDGRHQEWEATAQLRDHLARCTPEPWKARFDAAMAARISHLRRAIAGY